MERISTFHKSYTNKKKRLWVSNTLADEVILTDFGFLGNELSNSESSYNPSGTEHCNRRQCCRKMKGKTPRWSVAFRVISLSAQTTAGVFELLEESVLGASFSVSLYLQTRRDLVCISVGLSGSHRLLQLGTLPRPS